MRYYIRDGILYPEDPSDISKALAQIQAPAFYTRKIILNATADCRHSGKHSQTLQILSAPGLKGNGTLQRNPPGESEAG